MRKIKYSKDVDALIIELSDRPIDYAEEKGQLILHFTKEGDPVLIEILNAREFLMDSLQSVLQEREIHTS